MKKNNSNYCFLLSGLILLMPACSNPSANNNTLSQNADSASNAQTKGVTIKEKQRFHTQAQRSLDSLQRIVNNTDKEMKKKDDGARQKWDGTRDSLRKIIDKANRTLNNQSYKSDDDWKTIEKNVNNAIDSAQTVLKRDEMHP